jgi:hypothetical protein
MQERQRTRRSRWEKRVKRGSGLFCVDCVSWAPQLAVPLTYITRAWSYPIRGQKKTLAKHVKIQLKSELAHENQPSRFC